MYKKYGHLLNIPVYESSDTFTLILVIRNYFLGYR